eukprot:tig00021535_g22215.t1
MELAEGPLCIAGPRGAAGPVPAPKRARDGAAAPAGVAPPRAQPSVPPASDVDPASAALFVKIGRPGARQDAIYRTSWRRVPLDALAGVQGAPSASRPRNVAQVCLQPAVRLRDGRAAKLAFLGAFDLDVHVEVPAEVCEGAVGDAQRAQCKKEYLCGVLAEARTLGEYCRRLPDVARVARLAHDLAAACEASGLRALVVFSGLKGFHVVVMERELIARSEAARLYDAEDLRQWELRRARARARFPGDWKRASRSAGTRAVPGMVDKRRSSWRGADALAAVVKPWMERKLGPALTGALLEAGAVDVSTWNPNCGMREDTHYHGWTLRYPVAIADRTALVDPARGDAVDLCTARADPAIVAWNRDFYAWLRSALAEALFLDLPALPRPAGAGADLARRAAPKRRAEGAGEEGGRPRGRGPKRPRRGAPGATDPAAAAAAAAVDPSGPEVPPDRLRLARAVYPAESGREWERQGGEVEAYVSRPAGGPCLHGRVHSSQNTRLAVAPFGAWGVLAGSAHCFSLACAERPLRGALAFAEGLPAPPPPEAAEALGRWLPLLSEAANAAIAAARAARELPPLVLPDAAAAPYPARADLGTDTVEYRVKAPCALCGDRRGLVRVDALEGTARAHACDACEEAKAAEAAAAAGAAGSGPGPGPKAAPEVRLGRAWTSSISAVQRAVHRATVGAAVAAGLLPASTGLLGATEPRATQPPMSAARQKFVAGLAAHLEERLAAPAGSPDGPTPLEVAPEQAALWARVPLPSLGRPLAPPAGRPDLEAAWLGIDDDAGGEGPNRRYVDGARISRELEGPEGQARTLFLRGGMGDGKTRACVSISRAIVADPARFGVRFAEGQRSILYLVAGRLHAPEIQRDPEWATVARWVSYRDVRDGAPDAAALLSTVESVRRFDGVFPVVILDEGAKAIVTAVLSETLAPEARQNQALARLGRLLCEASIVLVSDADLCQHDVDYYLALRHPAPAAPGAARVVSYTLRPAPRGPAARREALAYPLGMAGDIVTALLLGGRRVAVASSDRRTLFRTMGAVRGHPGLRGGGERDLYVYADARAEERARALDKGHVCREVRLFAYNYAIHQGADYTDPEHPYDVLVIAESGRTGSVVQLWQLAGRVRCIRSDRVILCVGDGGGGQEEDEKAAEEEGRGGEGGDPGETDPEAILAARERALEETWGRRGLAGDLASHEMRAALRVQAHKLAVLRASRADPLVAVHMRMLAAGARGVFLPGGAQPAWDEALQAEAKWAAERALEIEIVLPHAAAPPLAPGREERVQEAMHGLGGDVDDASGGVADAERRGYRLGRVAADYRLREEEVGTPELRLALRARDAHHAALRGYGAAFLAHMETVAHVRGQDGGRNILPDAPDEAHSRRSAALLLLAAGCEPPVTPSAILSPLPDPDAAAARRAGEAARAGCLFAAHRRAPLVEAAELLALEPAARPADRLAALAAAAGAGKAERGDLERLAVRLAAGLVAHAAAALGARVRAFKTPAVRARAGPGGGRTTMRSRDERVYAEARIACGARWASKVELAPSDACWDDSEAAAAAGGADPAPLWAAYGEGYSPEGGHRWGRAQAREAADLANLGRGSSGSTPRRTWGAGAPPAGRRGRRGGRRPGRGAEAVEGLAGAVAGLGPAELAAVVRGGFAADARLDALAARLASEAREAQEARALRDAADGRRAAGGAPPATGDPRVSAEAVAWFLRRLHESRSDPERCVPHPRSPAHLVFFPERIFGADERLPGPNGVAVQRAGRASGRDLCVRWVDENKAPALAMRPERIGPRGGQHRGLGVPLALFAEMGVGGQQ